MSVQAEQSTKVENVQAGSKLTLFVCGDVMTGRGVDQVLPHSVSPELYEGFVKDARQYVRLAERESGNMHSEVSYDYIWGEAKEYWEAMNPRFKIINLETSITDHPDPWPGKGIHYRMHPKNVRVLSEAGIDHCALANNHTLDWGRAGLAETMASLENADIQMSGAGSNKNKALEPAVFDLEAGRLLVFSYGHRSSGIPESWSAGSKMSGINYIEDLNADRVSDDIRRFKNGNDIVIVSIHWGGNWGYQIPDEQRLFARALIDSGSADLIHGHSSHHPKGMEVYNGKLIIYGTGDFINDYEGISDHERYRGELSLMYFPTINTENGSLNEMRMVPMEIHKFRLQHASDKDIAWMRQTLDRECRKLGGNITESSGILELQWPDKP